MAEIIVHKSHGHTSMSTYHLWDKTITLKAKGLLSQMFSLPDEWDYSIQGLVDLNQEEETAVKTALRELKEKGYLKINKIPPSKSESKFTYQYEIFERPIIEQGQEGDFLPLEVLPLENQNQEKKEKKQKKEEKYISFNNNDFDSQDKGHSNNSNLNISEVNYTTPTKSTTKQDKISLKNKIIQLINSFTEDESLRKDLNEFVEHRKKAGKPVATEHAMDLLLRHLKALSNGNLNTMREMVDTSIRSGWLDFYPPKNQNNTTRRERGIYESDEEDETPIPGLW